MKLDSRILWIRLSLLRDMSLALLLALALETAGGCDGLQHTPAGSTSDSYPELFSVARSCPNPRDPIVAARRSEVRARFLEDRYPYDQRDGVRSVEELDIAATCYSIVGRMPDFARVRDRRDALAAQISSDYVDARLGLARAIESSDWRRALRETRRLRLLTSHLGGHDYVDWLGRISELASAKVRALR
ncbi:MAG: hypothetical protein AAF997_20025 [Myxococcota bacterium]